MQSKERTNKEALRNDPLVRFCEKASILMDKYCIDPLLGFIPGGVGDVVSQFMALPFIYVALFRIKSVPLALAMIYNSLKDMLAGAFPFFIGDLLDFFVKNHKKNYTLLHGFLEDDKAIERQVNHDAIKCAIAIALLTSLIILLLRFLGDFVGWVATLF